MTAMHHAISKASSFWSSGKVSLADALRVADWVRSWLRKMARPSHSFKFFNGSAFASVTATFTALFLPKVPVPNNSYYYGLRPSA